jgi:hypothetical protein
MKTTVSRYEFERAFVDADRKDQFSYEALGLLFAYFEELEEGMGEEVELDVIAICCDYTEDTVTDIANNYRIDLSECEDGICTASAHGLEQVEDAKRDVVRDYLSDNTVLIGETASGFVYLAF